MTMFEMHSKKNNRTPRISLEGLEAVGLMAHGVIDGDLWIWGEIAGVRIAIGRCEGISGGHPAEWWTVELGVTRAQKEKLLDRIDSDWEEDDFPRSCPIEAGTGIVVGWDTNHPWSMGDNDPTADEILADVVDTLVRAGIMDPITSSYLVQRCAFEIGIYRGDYENRDYEPWEVI